MAKVGCYLINFCYSNYIQWAMRSLKEQTKKPDVLIFIDDASTDNSMEVVERENKKLGLVFDDVIINDTNLGACKTINKAVDALIKAGCDYVFGLSADDLLMPDYIEKTSKALIEAPANVGYIYTWVRRIGAEFSIDKHPEFNSENLFKFAFAHGSSLIKKEAWLSVGGVPEVEFEEDWQMFKNMCKAGYIGKLIPEPLLCWRKHGKSRTAELIRRIKAERGEC